MTNKEIMEKLDELGVEYDPTAKKAELEKLLNGEQTPESTEQEDESEEPQEVAEPEPTPEQKAPKKEQKPIDYKTKIQRIKDSLAKQPKVRIIIPKEKSETRGAFETVQINGYMLKIMKGVYVEVPQQVADILNESAQIKEEAQAEAEKKMTEAEREAFGF